MNRGTLKTTAEKVVKVLLSILLSGLILLNLLTIIFTNTGLSEKLHWIPYAFLSVESGSMRPAINEGDLILIHSDPYESLAVGDTVTFYRNSGFITHRIIRTEGSRFVTQGLSNAVEDSSIGPEEYIGKVLKVFPGLGDFAKLMRSPLVLALLVLLLLVVFFGGPVISFIYDRISKEKRAFPKPGVVRVLSCIAAASLVLTAPCMTEAKYVAYLNDYDHMVANSNNFACDYLSDETKTYMMRGWNGKEYSLDFTIANYENSLLYNTSGHDVRYMIYIDKVEAEGDTQFFTNYSVVINEKYPDSVARSEEPFLKPEEWREVGTSDIVNPLSSGFDYFPGPGYGPFILEGNDFEGIAHDFSLSLLVDNGERLPSLGKVRFIVTAVTAPDETYYHHLRGEFTLETEESETFFRDVSINTTPGNALVSYSMKTNLIDGEATKKVVISWDPEVVYLNEFENTAYAFLKNDPGCLDRAAGTLTIYLQAFTSLDLQFFKHDLSLEDDDIIINARVAEVEERETVETE